MSSQIFLQTLQNKLRGGNSSSIHLSALPGRFAARLDITQLDLIREGVAGDFMNALLTEPHFTFPISFEAIDLNQQNQEEQKKLIQLSKRLDTIVIDNEDYYKEHGTKTLGFGYPILIKRSTKDPTKVIKAPLFIWPLEAVKSKKKVNEWALMRNRILSDNGKVVDNVVHSVAINEVLLSFIKGEDDILLPGLSNETLEDMVLDSNELLNACAEVLHALNPGTKEEQLAILTQNFSNPINGLPEAGTIDPIANYNAYIHFGGVLGLFRSQKESIITDITKLLERIDEFQFDDLKVDSISTTPFSAVDTDPSQQAIIGALGESPNQVIQGPPGTGKSWSLTALITNALANNLRCLVVCEKKTALDVIKQNLERRSEALGSLVAVIDDVNDDREAIVDSVRERQERLYTAQSAEQAAKQYKSATRTLSEFAGHINIQHLALGKHLFRGEAWTRLVGKYLQLLRQFGSVPLKNVLRTSDFKFQQEEQELDDCSSLLKKADNLYHQSKSVQEVFDCLHSNLFAGQTVGEARLRIERYSQFARSEIILIEKAIHTEQDVVQAWLQEEYKKLPAFLQQAVTHYLPFLEGRPLSPNPFPTVLPVEQLLADSLTSIEQLNIRSNEFSQTYQAQLTTHYQQYAESLCEALTDYLQFIQTDLDQYGESFLQNTRMARFKTWLFGIFSARHQDIRRDRVLVREKIAGIRTVHSQEAYIDHSYNDEEETKHLGLYIDNIKALQSKLATWQAAYPAQINRYLDYISETSLHAAHLELKPTLRTLFFDLTDQGSLLETRCGISREEPIRDLGSFQHETTRLQTAIAEKQALCQTVRNQFSARAVQHDAIVGQIGHLIAAEGGPTTFETFFPYYADLAGALNACDEARQLLDRVQEAMPGFRTFHEWKSFFQPLAPDQQELIMTVRDHLDHRWSEAFSCWYIFSLLTLFEPDNLPKDEYALGQFREQKAPFNRAQVNHILAQWTDRQRKAVQQFTSKGYAINSLFNKKGGKGMRRNSLRSILHQQFDLFTSFFPVLLVNPSVCSSILPLQEGLFDVIIFDEASQLRLEDTYAALLRGRAKVVSGDKHQMPPSSYFQSQGALLDPTDEDEADSEEEPGNPEERQAVYTTHRNLADSESLLTYAEDKGFKQSYLDIHYRSKHPALIDFSNHAFYGMRLIPLPPSEEYRPIDFIQVDGLYQNQTNLAEVNQVLDILQHRITPFPDGSYPTVGVATFNLYQRNLILEKIAQFRQQDAAFDQQMIRLGDSFFVKNLENIQGDERDIIILSTTFGRKENGTFTQQFGPIIQQRGHRMLNVIITRAKHRMIVCTSFPVEYISQYAELLSKQRNRGRAVLFAYLFYAKAVSDQNHDLRLAILQDLHTYCSEKVYDPSAASLGLGSESPFEEEVFERLSRHIGAERIGQQHWVGGFRIDMIIRSKRTGQPFIALECDGAKYHHSPEAYAWDLFRQGQIEQYGLIFHRIWSTNWWDAADKELERLLAFIAERDGREESQKKSEVMA